MRVLLLGRVSGGGEQEGCDCPGQLPAWLGVTGGTLNCAGLFQEQSKSPGIELT